MYLKPQNNTNGGMNIIMFLLTVFVSFFSTKNHYWIYGLLDVFAVTRGPNGSFQMSSQHY